MRTAPSEPTGADALVEDDDAEHGGGERLGEHERRHLRGVEAAEAAREQRVRERGRHDAEIERESEPVGVCSQAVSPSRSTGRSSTAPRPNDAPITATGVWPSRSRRFATIV